MFVLFCLLTLVEFFNIMLIFFIATKMRYFKYFSFTASFKTHWFFIFFPICGQDSDGPIHQSEHEAPIFFYRMSEISAGF